MNDVSQDLVSTPPPAAAPKTAGEKWEGLAFTFCKAATLILLTGRWALPVASGAAALFFLLTAAAGKHDTRCVLRVPLVIAVLWSVVCAFSLVRLLGIPLPIALPGG